ncbi:MAG: trypsin-like peptidase domain-containing protein [Paracoccaceae bacterium]|nr:trypsin-like peptidase domain-containing protein [Paracoccaceae bacterium]
MCLSVVCLAFSTTTQKASALPPDTTASVVSVLPVWPGRAQGGAGARPGAAPEGSGVVLRPGVVATAWHVIEPAERIDVRLSDGRVLPARLIAKDVASDIAVLSVDADVPPFTRAPRPALADPVCTIGNAWGLGLSVTCGVVSALDVTNAGFNPVEHFVQTDAAANPGVSGGALVDTEGRLVGMMSAIFASEGDANIGVNFAVSIDLLTRVTDALLEAGVVTYPEPGWQLSRPDREQLARRAAAVVAEVDADGPSAAAGVRARDLITMIDGYRVQTPRDAIAALALVPEDAPSVEVTLERDGQSMVVALPLKVMPKEDAETTAECPHPVAVCRMRQIVFPVSSFDPLGSATRIGPNLLVTNRHIVAARPDVVVHTPDGPLDGRVVASAYTGDLALIEVEGLPEGGSIPSLDGGNAAGQSFAIGADITRQEIRAFDPGQLIALPAEGAELGRLHVTSYMQPGVSGGALVNENGALIGISVGGGDGRYEAIPLEDVRELLALRDTENAVDITEQLGAALSECAGFLETVQPRAAEPSALENLADICAATKNHGQLLEAGRTLAMAGDFDAAIALHAQAVGQVPNSINARVSLLVSMQLAARFKDMIPHARRVMALAPDDPQVLRFAIQSGVWGGAPELADEGYAALLKADPRQAQAARRFIDNAPPAPVRR